MTPKEKAKELVDKFRDFANGSDYETDGFSPNIEKENGKQCALIAVDKLLNANGLHPNDTDYDYNKAELYWQEVKQEIEKL